MVEEKERQEREINIKEYITYTRHICNLQCLVYSLDLLQKKFASPDMQGK
jgi:hypothetical protein